MDNPKSVGEPATGSAVDRSKKRNQDQRNQDHAEGSKKSKVINLFDRPLKKCKTKKGIQNSKNEIIELSRSIKELTEAVKSLPEILLTIVKDRETTPGITVEKITEEEEMHPGCHMHIPKNPCIDCQKVGHHNNRTIMVLGLDELTLPRDQVKNMLRDLFGSCGEITRLSVPIDYKTGLPVGFAFVDLKNGQGYEKALELDYYELEGVELEVTLAQNRLLSFDYDGCERCMSDASARRAPAVVQPEKSLAPII